MKSEAEKISNDVLIEKQTRRKRRERREASNYVKLEPVKNDNYKNATHFITPQTDFVKLFSENFGINACEVPSLCLSGLHTCGNLAPSCLRIFSENDQIIALCNIGCCYHLLSEQFDTFVYQRIRRERNTESKQTAVFKSTDELNESKTIGFPMSNFLIDRKTKLGRNARMLACQSIHRIVDKKELPSGNLFFRALLEVLIQRRFPEYFGRLEIGRIKPCHTFAEYVRKSAKRSPVLEVDDISDEQLAELHDEFRNEEQFLDIYHLMRVSIAALIESVIYLDRFLYLKERENGNNMSFLVRFFDPVVSPRCYGHVAMKNFKKL